MSQHSIWTSELSCCCPLAGEEPVRLPYDGDLRPRHHQLHGSAVAPVWLLGPRDGGGDTDRSQRGRLWRGQRNWHHRCVSNTYVTEYLTVFLFWSWRGLCNVHTSPPPVTITAAIPPLLVRSNSDSRKHMLIAWVGLAWMLTLARSESEWEIQFVKRLQSTQSKFCTQYK